MNKNLWLFRL